MGDRQRLLSKGGTESHSGFKGMLLTACGEWTVGAGAEAGSPGRRVTGTRMVMVEVVRRAKILDLL